MNGASGLQGWQWMFLIEGLLAALAGICAHRFLTNKPADAVWLSDSERSALKNALEAEDRHKTRPEQAGRVAAIRPARMLQLGLIYGLIQISTFGVTFYLPSEVSRLLDRKTGFIVGLVSAVPWICALAAAYAVPRLAKASGRRSAVGGITLILAGVGIALSSTDSPVLGLAALCLAAAGFIGVQPLFWTIPADELSGVGAAGGIALINSLGSVGSFLAPILRVRTEILWSSSLAGVLALAITTWIGALLFFFVASRGPSGTDTA